MVKKIYKSYIQISHKKVYYAEEGYIDYLKSDCKNRVLIEASKEFNNLQISEIYIDTTTDMKEEFYGNQEMEDLYISNFRLKCNYYEVQIIAW